MFTGFENDTFEFFMALSFNNNREFFHANHDWYEKSVRAPLKELAMDIAPAMLEIDPDFEVRPAKVISHINRDLRYSKNKAPYRDYMWLGFHRAELNKADCFHMYFDISAESANVGAGMYGDDRTWMDALRREIAENTGRAADILMDGALDIFHLEGTDYSRIKLPDGLPDGLKKWYTKKGLYIGYRYSPQEAMSAALAKDIIEKFSRLKRLYNYMYEIKGSATV